MFLFRKSSFIAFLLSIFVRLGLLVQVVFGENLKVEEPVKVMSSSWSLGGSIWKAAKRGMTKGIYAGSSQWKEEMGLFHTLKAKDAKHAEVDFAQFKGKLCLITNVASKCGYTQSSYEAMQKMIDAYHSKGLEILLFPCNQFMGQEPTSAEEAATWVCTMFGTEMSNAHWFEKGDINGENTQPVYAWLKQAFPGDIGWNFASRFIIGADGIPLKRFDHGTPWVEVDKYLADNLPTETLSDATVAADVAEAETAEDCAAADDSTLKSAAVETEATAASAETEEKKAHSEETDEEEDDYESSEGSLSSVDFESHPREAVDEAIKALPIVVFSKSYCPFCNAAKTRLRKYVDIRDAATVKIVELDRMNSPSAREVQTYLGTLTGATTVPRIFVAGKCIGGNDESKTLDAEGKLEQLVTSALSKL